MHGDLAGDNRKYVMRITGDNPEGKDELDNFILDALSDDRAMLSYRMHTLPSEIGESIGTSTLFAAWNAAIYVAQIEDQRLAEAVHDGQYLESTAKVLQKYGGLWFNDETFVVVRR